MLILSQNASLLIAAFVGLAAVLVFYKRRRRGPRHPVPADTVLIFGVGRGVSTPSASPFPLKLETFCRMAQVPYMVDHGHQMSCKAKTPWMQYNGQQVADSQFCIEHLKAQRNIHLDSNMSLSLKAQGRAFRELTEENLYWTLCYESLVKHPENMSKAIPYSGLKLKLLQMALVRVVKNEMWGHGIGRHSDSEIWDIALRDLTALSHFLGDKLYFLGQVPSEVDCAIFSMLCQIVFPMAGSRHDLHVREHLPNLVAYVDRMKTRFWPDWNERCMGANYVEDEYKLYAPNPAWSCSP